MIKKLLFLSLYLIVPSAEKADLKADRRIITWAEVEAHRGRESRWVVIDGRVYDVTVWQAKHPGGARILGHYAGQDATVRNIAGSGARGGEQGAGSMGR